MKYFCDLTNFLSYLYENDTVNVFLKYWKLHSHPSEVLFMHGSLSILKLHEYNSNVSICLLFAK